MKSGVVIFPGSNCDEDVIRALETVSGKPVTRLWHKAHDLEDCELVVLPGGFSYGDYLRSGAIARFSPIMQEVVKHAERGGYVMGICNGFQILTEAGLLPGALLRNQEQRFICKNVHVKPATKALLPTQTLDPERPLSIPIAHGEGRYYAPAEMLEEVLAHDQVLFRYCHSDGTLTEAANCNGSLDSIAGVSNRGRNVFGMMPHPERAADPELGNTDGRLIFESLLGMV
jgi:phosphoribosylformylglycinamidine synthase I